ncbi:hypothetical protein [Zooshikella sp. RANM57]|uniref:hypothetical protein n=1 Tax=Zooshikella sp. RANM57 TaxID=3425863 RepID=UPI003D6E3B85
MSELNLIPYVGVGPISFGMAPKEVEAVLGRPDSISTSGRNELEEHRGEITIRYDSETNGVVEISFGPESGLMLDGVYLYSSSDLTKYLLSKDPHPVECFGFLLYLNLGIAATGFHDGDEDQKAISVFQKGRWDSMKDNFTPF